MARHATIIGRAKDLDGFLWDVREERQTEHGFPILIGWPAGCRGKGFGGPRVIPSAEIWDYFDARRMARDGSIYALPIARTTIKRVRNLMGFDLYLEHEEWWLERIEDLTNLTGVEFARRHEVADSQVSNAHTALIGRRIRKPNWYREPGPIKLILSDLPHAHVSEKLGISRGASARLRSVLKREGKS